MNRGLPDVDRGLLAVWQFGPHQVPVLKPRTDLVRMQ
jgi:hypothetical protein